jgi:hypothetical protein
MGRIKILHCSGLAAAHRGVLRSFGVGGPLCPDLDFRTIQVCPKDRLTCHWQAPPAANRLRTVARRLV